MRAYGILRFSLLARPSYFDLRAWCLPRRTSRSLPRRMSLYLRGETRVIFRRDSDGDTHFLIRSEAVDSFPEWWTPFRKPHVCMLCTFLFRVDFSQPFHCSRMRRRQLACQYWLERLALVSSSRNLQREMVRAFCLYLVSCFSWHVPILENKKDHYVTTRRIWAGMRWTRHNVGLCGASLGIES